MNVMIKTDTLHSNPQVIATSRPEDVLSYAVVDSEIGKVLVARSAKGVCSIQSLRQREKAQGSIPTRQDGRCIGTDGFAMK